MPASRQGRGTFNVVASICGGHIDGAGLIEDRYVDAIRRAPLSPAQRRECCLTLTRWAAGRVGPVVRRTLRNEGLRRPETH
ncbi:MAG TPA: hypothetical protein VME46_20835 [Acidimicrobiales bacterium]|nr:hypothetical protein [Acidimicrobiales bacterium]